MISYPALEPFFAPLSRPMLQRALLAQEAPSTSTAPVLLHERMGPPRDEIFHLMQPVVKQKEFTTQWMLNVLTQFTPKRSGSTKPLSAEALSRWRETGLVVYQHKNIPDYDNGAALILLRRLIQGRERGWLPLPPQSAQKRFFAHEPLWWCWRQDIPDSPVLPCPVPLPEELPASALLWTRPLSCSYP